MGRKGYDSFYGQRYIKKEIPLFIGNFWKISWEASSFVPDYFGWLYVLLVYLRVRAKVLNLFGYPSVEIKNEIYYSIYLNYPASKI